MTTQTDQTSLQDSLNNINDVFFKIVQTNVGATLPASFDTWFAPENTDVVNNAITALFKTKGSYPTWEEFINYISAQTSPAEAATIEQNFVKGYRFALFTDPGIPSTINTNKPPGQDFSAIQGITAQDLQTQFEAAFTYLSKNFPTTFDGNNLPDQLTPDLFKQVFLNFTARSVLMQNSSLNNLPPAQTIFKNQQLVATYQQIYDQYYPNTGLTPAERDTQFNELLNGFYNAEVSQKGFFIPTQSFQDWGNFLNMSASLRVFGNETSLASMGAQKTEILNRIFELLVALLNTIQQTSVVQSDRLNFYTAYQNEYTQKLATIPVFTSKDNTYIGSSDDQAFVQARQDLNSKNSSFTEKLTAERQVISDEAQTQQTAITQSIDAGDQQANFCSSILEQLSSLLSSIYR